MGLSDKMQGLRPHLLFVVGPTACGKSDFAVEAAEALNFQMNRAAEILNCDSVQFFDGVDIGAAKPSPDLMSRVPHHLVGHTAKGATYTAGDFRRDALRVIQERSTLGIFDFLPVGGSGFYVQALEKGMYEVPEVPREIRDGVESDLKLKGLDSLYSELEKRDPEAASKIKSADRYRILRALEILRSAPPEATLTKIRAEFERQRPPSPFRVSKVGLFWSRDLLRQRVTLRTQTMLRAGLLDEVQELREQGLKDWGPLNSVGYREAQEYLDGLLKREDLESAIVTSTMQLAKRQMTWFKRDPEIRWFNVETGFKVALQEVMRLFQP